MNLYNTIYKYWGSGFPTFTYSGDTVYFGVYFEENTVNNYCIKYVQEFINSKKSTIHIPAYKNFQQQDLEILEGLIQLIRQTPEEILMEIISQVAVAKAKNLERFKSRKLPKRDNKGYYAGGGRPHRGDCVRKPSKKHKNQWKQFIKLFPQYTDEYNKIFNNL